jgi:hypothetical protein
MAINMVASVPRTVACSESEVLSGQRSQLPGKSLLLGQPCHGAVFLLQLELRNRLKNQCASLPRRLYERGRPGGPRHNTPGERLLHMPGEQSGDWRERSGPGLCRFELTSLSELSLPTSWPLTEWPLPTGMDLSIVQSKIKATGLPSGPGRLNII